MTAVNGQAYTWDNNGNPSASSGQALLNDGEKSYVNDQANRLTNISANGLAWSATYNGDGARLRQVTNGVATTYTLDPSASSGQALNAGLVQVLTMQDAGGKTAYLYGVTRIGEQQPGGWAYHLSDALGSVRQLADDAAQVTLARGYMPYGEELWSLGEGGSAYGYTGEDWNTTIQMVFLRARYMQPGLGVFLSHDPWDGDELRPGSMNGWNYVEGNPTNKVDPSGTIPHPPWPCGECEIDAALDNGHTIVTDKNLGFYKDQLFFFSSPSWDKMDCIFVQWVKGQMVKWNNPSRKVIDVDTHEQWMVDIPGGQPMLWNTSPSRTYIREGPVYKSMSGEPMAVLEYLGGGIGWYFHDTPGYPPKELGTGVTYQVKYDFEIRVYKKSDWDEPYPVPVYTKAWDFHWEYTVK